ncbi:MAG: toll/interleukin-1 receptor domain-containing protein [Syntrophorhabdales bacterium]|jgi:hypothetical protein
MPPRKRRGNRELFLDTLGELSNGGKKFIGNITLQKALGWDKARYSRIKAQLRHENSISIHTGQGGSICLSNAVNTSGLRLFISYSHADEGLKDELLKHILPLKRLNLIDSWEDRKLLAGEDWEKSINDNLEKADIILLLVSVDFINSEYCFGIELERAMALHEEQKARVIPVILRDCLWQHTRFGKIQVLPKNAKAVRAWPDQDEALKNVAEGILKVVEDIRNPQ